jgi:TAT-translocated FGD2 family F420-dependent dehydrogenase
MRGVSGTQFLQRHPFDRRALLKSAAGAFIGASALHLGSETAFARKSNSQRQDVSSGQLRKHMLGFMLPHEQFPVPQLIQFGIAAEAAGFDLLATSDHFQPWQSNEGHSGEAWVTMGALGAHTRRVWIGPTVTCPTFRYNPAVVAEAFASLSLLSPGRIFLGVGSGEALNEQAATGVWPQWSERSERLIEATQLIRQLWTGQPVDHQGKYYNVHARLFDAPPKPIPLLMAANGPKAMRRAGQYGDGLITDPKTWKQHKNEFLEGAKAAGKDSAEMPVLVEQYVVVGSQEDAKAAAELWRFGPKAFKSYYNIRDPQAIQQRADSEIPLDQVYADWPVSTDPAAHLKVINELFESGVSIVNIHTGQSDQEKTIEFYGKEIVPKVKRS